MNILYIAYSCSPYHGSEDKIGWNIPMESAKTNKVYVITKEEQRRYIEEYLSKNAIENIEFYFVDIPSAYKQIFSGSFYSGRLNLWNKRAEKLAKEICSREHIDIIHQITPVEFRSIGNYGSIPGVKFVCGPIAGGQMIPRALWQYAKPKAYVECFRSIANWMACMWLRVSKRFATIDGVLFVNAETQKYLQNEISNNVMTDLLTDISIAEEDLENNHGHKKSTCRFVVVGRLVYLKGHALLLDALSKIPDNCDYVCRIVGAGEEEKRLRQKCCLYGLQDRVIFEGKVPYVNIAQIYETSDVLIMPSLREATGSVVLEAMSKGLPVIAMNKFGAATIVDERSGWLYDGNTKDQYIENLANAIMTCIENPEAVRCKGQHAYRRAKDFTWENRMKKYQEIYEKTLRNGE